MGTPVDVGNHASKFTTIFSTTSNDILDRVEKDFIVKIVDGDWVHVQGNSKQINNMIANYIGNDYADDILVYRFVDIKQELVFLRKNMYYMNILTSPAPGDERMNSICFTVDEKGVSHIISSKQRGARMKYMKRVMGIIERKWEDYRLTVNKKGNGFDIVLGFRGNKITIMRPDVTMYPRNRLIKLINNALKRLQKYRKDLGK